MLQALLPVLKQAAAANSSLPQGTSRAAIVNVSSVLGSIADNNQGGFYPYRSSKAALNAITRSLSLDLKSDNILVMSLHPGWVKTDMGGAQAPLTTETAVTAIVDLLSSVGAEHNGGFYQYDDPPHCNAARRLRVGDRSPRGKNLQDVMLPNEEARKEFVQK
ncbi:hypothetical protein J6590_073550 [Homalodisca vitripennis]|nr:hypothetical protein J6590_073550 [Homalodisca vitripennis]